MRTQGVGLNLPWDVFVTARNYFYRRFCGTDYAIIFEISIATGYNFSRLFALIWTLRYQDRYSIRGRTIGALTVLGLMLFLCCISVLLDDMNISVLFVTTMILVVISGICNAITDGVFFALATYFPPQYTQALMVGMSVSGLIMSLMAIFTQLASPDESYCPGGLGTGAILQTGGHEGSRRLRSTSAVSGTGGPDSLCPDYQTDWATFVYFAIGVSITVVCLVSYLVLEKLPYSIAHMKHGEVRTVLPAVELSAVSPAHTRARDVRHPEVPVEDGASEKPTVQLLENFPLSEEDPTMVDSTNVDETMEMDTSVSDNVRDTWSSIAWHSFSVFFVYAITFALHPGITSVMLSSRECRPGHWRLFSREIFTSFLFVSVTFFDCLGRVLSGVVKAIPDAWLPLASAARVVFVPLLLGCRLELSRLPTLCPSDAFTLSVVAALAFTNGYTGSLGMMAGSRYGPWAGSAMTTAILSGCMAGSLLSFPILYGVTGSFV